MTKSVIYLEVDDDITSVIDKVKNSDSQIVALVPPKRFSVLQSRVNLKLLKKQSHGGKKKIVIISKDSSLLPLAGSLNVYVADTLQSRPYIPDAPDFDESADLEIDDELSTDHVSGTPVGILNKAQPREITEGEEVKPASKIKSKKLLASLPRVKGKIPNFNKFRTKLFLGISLIIFLAVGWYVAFFVMPKASIVVNAQTNRVRLELEVTLDEEATSDDITTNTLKPTTETLKKSFTGTFPATGEKNIGLKASGLMTIRNCDSSSSVTVPSGTTFTSSGGTKFVSTADASVPGGSFSGGGCDTPGETVVNVQAVESGTSSNVVAGLSYTVSDQSNLITGVGGKMSGGTDDIQKVVSATDIAEGAKTLEKTVHDEFIAEIEAQFSTSLTPITTSFEAKKGKAVGEPAAGEAADEVTVTLTYTYTMLGVSTESMDKILEAQLAEMFGTDFLVIYDNGLEDASMKITDSVVSITANSFVGPELNEDAIAQEVAGLRFSAAKQLLEDKDGVKSVEIDLSPFWVFSMPKKDKITVTINIAEHALQEIE